VNRHRRLLLIFAALTGILLAGGAPAQSAPPLKMAVHPYNSTLALITVHQPLQRSLAATLGRPVEFYTAASFEAFAAALKNGEYDIVICPPHFGVIAAEGDYVPLLNYTAQLVPLLVVRSDSPLHQARDFRGKRIAMADKTAFIRIAMVKWLADNGLKAGRDYRIVERPTHGAAVAAAAAGEADAGLAPQMLFRQLPADMREQIRALDPGMRFPNLFTLAHKRLGTAEIARVRQALLTFAGTTAGREFMEMTGFQGYDAIEPAELRALKTYADFYLHMTEN
jgi:phosphonate transport system substrate-binding protein